MKKLITIGLLFASFTTAPSAIAGEKVDVKVKGMVCSFCAQGIKKKFAADPSVASVNVNLDDKWVKLELKDGATLADDKITTLITSAGYNVESIQRSAEAAAAQVPVAAPPSAAVKSPIKQ